MPSGGRPRLDHRAFGFILTFQGQGFAAQGFQRCRAGLGLDDDQPSCAAEVFQTRLPFSSLLFIQQLSQFLCAEVID